jgi:uncharacterized integral membrane protein
MWPLVDDHCLAARSPEATCRGSHPYRRGCGFRNDLGTVALYDLHHLAERSGRRGEVGSIKHSRWTWVAWSMLAIYIVSLVFAVILQVANGTFQRDAAGQVALGLGFSAFMVVGALIVAHQPGNAIGWIFAATALLAVTVLLAGEYAIYAYSTRPGSLPGAIVAAWSSSWLWWVVLVLALVFTPLLFPTGRLLSPRWRPVAWLAGVATAALSLLSALQANLEPVPDHLIANPIGSTRWRTPTRAPSGSPYSSCPFS